MHRWFRQFQYWKRRDRLDAELLEELEAHRAMREAELRRSGMSDEEAAYASRRALGNVTLAREEARAVWTGLRLESAWQDVTYAARTLRRYPRFAASFIIVAALGLGATTAVFALLDGLVLKSLPVAKPSQLVWFRDPAFSYPIFNEVRARGSQVFSGLFAWNLEQRRVDWAGELEAVEVLEASGTFYATLGVSPALGRTFTEADDSMGGGSHGLVAVISYSCWQHRFGRDPGVVGRRVRIDRQPFTIIGVAPAGFFGVAPGLAPEITIPLKSLQTERDLTTPSSAWLHIMGRLHDDLALSHANAAAQTFWPAVLEATTSPSMPADRRAMYLGRKTALQPGHTGYSRVRNQFEEPLWMLLALVGLLQAVACASAANLQLARGLSRQREIAIRMAIGASRSRVIQQVLTESLALVSISILAAVLLASWAGSVLVTMMTTWDEPIILQVAPNWRVVMFATALAAVTAVLATLVPAFQATRLDPGGPLKETHPSGGVRQRSLGRWLVAAQVAVTVLLLVGAALFARSLYRVFGQDAGFDRPALLVLSTDPMAAGYGDGRLARFYDLLLAKLRAIPGVESASLSLYPPISDDDGSWTQSVGVDGATPTTEVAQVVYFNAVSPDYFRTIGLAMAGGRDFTAADTASSVKVAIVNESLARKYFPDQNPIGRRITIGRHASRRDLEIIGVVRNAKYQRLQEPVRSIAYLPHAQLAEFLAGENLFAEIRAAGSVAPLADTVRREIRAFDAGVPIRLETVDDRIRGSLVRERVIAFLASALAMVAVALASASLFGLLAYAVSRKSREIGVRMALGAARIGILWMVMRECLLVALSGIAIGLLASLGLGRFARSLLYQITTTDTASLVSAALIMLVVAAFAGLAPALRATRVDPVVALRCE